MFVVLTVRYWLPHFWTDFVIVVPHEITWGPLTINHLVFNVPTFSCTSTKWTSCTEAVYSVETYPLLCVYVVPSFPVNTASGPMLCHSADPPDSCPIATHCPTTILPFTHILTHVCLWQHTKVRFTPMMPSEFSRLSFHPHLHSPPHTFTGPPPLFPIL